MSEISGVHFSFSEFQFSAFQICPRREWSRWEASDIDEARRVSERARANQSNQRVEVTLSCPPDGVSSNVPGGNRTRI